MGKRYSGRVTDVARRRSTTFGNTLLWITAVAFVGFGLGFIAAPDYLADLVTGAAPSTPSGAIDMRATYGGPALGLGIFFALAAAQQRWLRPALLTSMLVVACIAAGRIVGIAIDGEPNGFMVTFLVLEVASVVLYALALRRTASEAA